MKRIAIIGSGISGLAAGYLLSRRHEVHLFECAPRLGGHTNTIVVDVETGPLPLDTGFLVHNDRTYPNLVRLFAELGVETQPSDMSFSVSCTRTGFEYSSRGARGFFAQKRNLLRAPHLRLLAAIARFNRRAPRLLKADDVAHVTLGDFLDEERYGPEFIERYLYPMASAIWSASVEAIRSFPATTLVRFLDNHGLLGINTQPQWKVVRSGSQTYIPLLTAPYRQRIWLNARIRTVYRDELGVTLHFLDRSSLRFDEVVFACHGNQVLPLLATPRDVERDVLRHFQTTRNDAWLHTDDSVLPRRPLARASWNYRLGNATGAPPTVSYDLNRLQTLTTRGQYCVTLNPCTGIDERRVLRKLVYHHPLYDAGAIRAQNRWTEVSGAGHTHLCGAYWFYGFHEDGLRSAIRVASALGVEWS
jgi:predicted NAD/FAD-binding protein